MSNEEKPVGEIVFEYKGGIYNRPLGRGIDLEDYKISGLSLEDLIPDGYFDIEVTVRQKVEPQE